MRECDEGQDIVIEGKKEHDKPRRTFSERLIGCRLKRVHEDVRGRERRKHVKLSGGWLADIEPGGTQDTESTHAMLYIHVPTMPQGVPTSAFLRACLDFNY